MSKICKITGKKPNVANNVSHANNKTKRRQFANLQNKKIFVPELGKNITTKLSTKAIKTIDKYGLLPYLKKKGLSLQDISWFQNYTMFDIKGDWNLLFLYLK